MSTTRRNFLKSGAILTSATMGTMAVDFSQAADDPAPRELDPASPDFPNRPRQTHKGDMIYRTLGKTGQEVSAIGMGGFHIGMQKEEADSIKLIRAAVDAGITFLDNSWDYNEGQSEIRMGKALENGYRDKVFVMTKVDGRTKASAAEQLEQSLKRLQTDHLDLWQFHEIIQVEAPDRIFAPDGAIHAAIDARKAGKVRFIGFTGHKDPFVHLRMLKVAADHDFHFDTVQMPVNIMDANFRSFQRLVMPEALKQEIGVLAMKTFGDHFILDEVLKNKLATPIELLHYSLNMPVSVVITGMDKPEILQQALQAAKTFEPLNADQVAALRDKTRQMAMTGTLERFKTTSHFDSTAKHPEWLG